MQKITLICVGRIKESWAQEACQQYINRIGHETDFELLELPASKQSDPDKQIEEESDRIIEVLSKRDGSVWVLDERGKSFSSKSFSSGISKLRDEGSSIIFIIGGAYGLSDEVRNRSDQLLALSEMTLAHELCRAVFLEQLYRSLQIIKNTEYNH